MGGEIIFFSTKNLLLITPFYKKNANNYECVLIPVLSPPVLLGACVLLHRRVASQYAVPELEAAGFFAADAPSMARSASGNKLVLLEAGSNVNGRSSFNGSSQPPFKKIASLCERCEATLY